MDKQTDKRGRRTTGCVIFLAVVGGAAVLACCGALGNGIWWWGEAGRELDAELARLEVVGEPTTAEQLEAFYELPEGEFDASGLLREVLAAFDDPEFERRAAEVPIVGKEAGDAPIPPPGQPWDDRPRVERLLADYAPSMRLLHEVAEKGGAARLPTDFAAGFAAQFPELAPLRTAARMLSLEAHLRAHRGDAAGAAHSIHALLRLHRSLEHYPAMISQLVRVAIFGMAADLIQRLLPEVDFPEEQLSLLRRDLQEIDFHDGLYRSLVGERVSGLITFENPEVAMDDEVDLQTAEAIRNFMALRKSDRLFYLEQMRTLVEATDKSWPVKLEICRNVDRQIEQTFEESKFARFQLILSALLLPAIGAASEAFARSEAVRHVTDTAIAVELYRRQHGALPDRLEQLVPAYLESVPLDPFDGQPLRYRVTDEELVIYSIGRNLLDDNGVGDLAGETDIVFRLPR